MKLRTVDLDGPVHYADFGGDGPPIVMVHGLGGSHLNWMSVGPALARNARVLAPDLPGFGLSPPGRRGVGLAAARQTLARFIREVAGGSAVLFGNSMGGFVSAMLAGRFPELVTRLVLVNPAQPLPRLRIVDPVTAAIFIAYAVPGVGEAFVGRGMARLGAEGMVRYMLDRCCVDSKRVAEEVVLRHVELTRRREKEAPWSNIAFLRAARSLLALLLLRPEEFHRAIDRIRAPTLLVHGERDRVVPVEASRQLARRRPDWTLEIFADAGHVPMLEHPRRFLETYRQWEEGTALQQTG